MIEIKSKSIRRFGKFVAITGAPAVLVQFAVIGEGLIKEVCFIYILALGVTGILVAIFERIGIVRFKYSSTEKNSRMFRMARDCARVEKDIWGKVFSEKYYLNYLEDEENHKENV